MVDIAEGEMEPFYTAAIADTIPSELLRDEVIEITRKCLGNLPKKVLLVWEKNRLEGLSYKEIADEMHCSVKQVDKLLQQASKALKKALSDYL